MNGLINEIKVILNSIRMTDIEQLKNVEQKAQARKNEELLNQIYRKLEEFTSEKEQEEERYYLLSEKILKLENKLK